MKGRFAWGMVGLLLLAGTAVAQEAAPPSQDGASQEAGQAQQERGQRRRVRPDGMMRGGGFGQDFTRILNLTPEQQTKVREIMQSAREQSRQSGQGMPRRSPEQMRRARELRQQLNEAAEAGDDVRVEQLQAELQSADTMEQFRQQQAKTYEEIEKILTPEQKVKFQQWRATRESGLPPQLASNPEALQKAVMGIKTLSDIQKNQLEAIFERYNREANSPAATAESKQALAAQVTTDVLAELKPSQKVLLTAGNRQFGPGRGGRGQRGGNGADPGASPAPTAAPDAGQ